MSDENERINKILQLNLLENSEVLDYLDLKSKKFDDTYKLFIDDSLKVRNITLNYYMVSQFLTCLLAEFEQTSRNIESQVCGIDLEMRTNEQSKTIDTKQGKKKHRSIIRGKIHVEKDSKTKNTLKNSQDSNQSLYESTTMRFEEFLNQRMVKDYFEAVQSALSNNRSLPTKNNIEDQLLEGFYSNTSTPRSSFDFNNEFDSILQSEKRKKDHSNLKEIESSLQYQEEVEEEEQGVNGDTFKQQKGQMICFVKKRIVVEDEKCISELQQVRKQLEFERQKVKDMQKQLLGLATGYIRDLNHFKEMAIVRRKGKEEDIFEVKYFDSTVILDEDTRTLLNDKLDDMHRQFEKKFWLADCRYQFAQSELEKVTKIIKEMLSQSDYYSLLKAVFKQEPNEYLIWKAIIDLKGLNFMYNIIQHQKPEYGIDYTEMNEFLAKNQVQNKLFERFKRILEEKQEIIIQNYTQLANEMKKQLEKAEKQASESERTIQEVISVCLHSQEEVMKKQIQKQYNDEYDEKKRKLFESLGLNKFSTLTVEKLLKKMAFQRWIFCIQLLSKRQISKSKLAQLLNTQNKFKRRSDASKDLEDQSKGVDEINLIRDPLVQEEEKQQIDIPYEWGYEEELEAKELKIKQLEYINAVVQRRVIYVQSLLEQFAKENHFNLCNNKLKDSKLKLLQDAFREICKNLKFSYDLQINEMVFQDASYDYRVKQFLKSISLSSKDMQACSNFQIDQIATAFQVLHSVNSVDTSGKFISRQCQTDIASVNVPLSQLETELIFFQKQLPDYILNPDQASLDNISKLQLKEEDVLDFKVYLDQNFIRRESITQFPSTLFIFN